MNGYIWPGGIEIEETIEETTLQEWNHISRYR